MYKIKLILIKMKSNAYKILLNIIVLISSFIVIKTAESPLLIYKNSYLIQTVFTPFKSDNALYQAIFTGIIVSYIFYIIVVVLPDNRKSKNIDLVLNKEIGEVVFLACSILNSLIKQSNTKFQIRQLSRDRIINMCNSIRGDSTVKNVVKNFNYDQYYYNEYLVHQIVKLQTRIEVVLKINGLIDSQFLKLLYQLKESKLCVLHDSLLKPHPLESELIHYGELFVEYFNATKNLNTYYYAIFSKTHYGNNWDKNVYGYSIELDWRIRKLTLHRGYCNMGHRDRIIKIDKNKILIGKFKHKLTAVAVIKFLNFFYLFRLNEISCKNNCV